MPQEGQAQDILQVQGRMTYGYGIIPKMAMQDKRLTVEARPSMPIFAAAPGPGRPRSPASMKS